MIDVESLVELVRRYNPQTNADLIRAAYAYGAKAHEGQFRRSGEPYFVHPVEVAALLTEVRLDDATIVTALLHDTIEDTGSTYDEIAKHFGDEVAQLVDGVTKLTNLELSSVETEQAENFRKLLIAMSKDLRVLLVKLADRLHNMRTIKALPAEKQLRKARETMDIYAPLAGRMGMQYIRDELEDLSFQVLSPEARLSILRRFAKLRHEHGDLIPRITDDIGIALDAAGVDAYVTGREKRPYSVWRKMEEKKQGFNQLSDVYGFRIVTANERDAYIALGAVHQRWQAVPGRFKDYISQPKSNGYRSIHTTVSGRDGKRVEVQIRTREMHVVAETGVAAHWSYKDGEKVANRFAVDPFHWLRGITERLQEPESPDEFLEHFKMEMFQDKVFCFSPKGEVIKLPKGATPIDFAYAIHTRLGNSCVGARINGNRMPLWTRLRNGQQVEILRSEGQRPQASWEDMVVTGRAKSAIRRALRDEHRGTHSKLGREIARVALERVGKKVTDKALDTAARNLLLGNAEELLVRLGNGETSGHDLVGVLYPELLKNILPAPEHTGANALIGLPAGHSAQNATCCGPVPGERIVGIMVPGKSVVIHAIDCIKLAEFDDSTEEWLDLRWPNDVGTAIYSTRIVLTMANDAGVLGRICTLVGEHNANIVDLEFTDRKPDFYRVMMEIMVRDVEHLQNVLTAIEADTDIAEVIRYRDSTSWRSASPSKPNDGAVRTT